MAKLDLRQPESDIAFTIEKALMIADEIGYPVLVRPSYVLGGRSMEIIYDRETLQEFMVRVLDEFPDNAILIDKFLEDAIEVDVDSISDGEMTVIGGIMEHIEEAGIHSGDSACCIPPQSLDDNMLARIENTTRMIARELNVLGLMNIQYAVKEGELYVIEVNPRASRTVPFVSKAIGVPLAKLATKVMLGNKLEDLGFTQRIWPQHVSVKEAVFPFNRFPDADVVLSPEMRSTGEVMGVDENFGLAFAKSQMAAGFELPVEGTVFVSVPDYYRDKVAPVVRELRDLGFRIVATDGTARHLEGCGIESEVVRKVSEGRPNVVDLIKNNEIQLIINTSIGRRASADSAEIRKAAIKYSIPYTTTIPASRAVVQAVRALKCGDWSVKPLQVYHSNIKAPTK